MAINSKLINGLVITTNEIANKFCSATTYHTLFANDKEIGTISFAHDSEQVRCLEITNFEKDTVEKTIELLKLVSSNDKDLLDWLKDNI